jgi:hypothetical protein
MGLGPDDPLPYSTNPGPLIIYGTHNTPHPQAAPTFKRDNLVESAPWKITHRGILINREVMGGEPDDPLAYSKGGPPIIHGTLNTLHPAAHVNERKELAKRKIIHRGIIFNREAMGLGPDDPIPHSVSKEVPSLIQEWPPSTANGNRPAPENVIIVGRIGSRESVGLGPEDVLPGSLRKNVAGEIRDLNIGTGDGKTSGEGFRK